MTLEVLNTPLWITDYECLSRDLLAHKAGSSPLVVDFSNTQIVTMRRHNLYFRKLTTPIDHFVPDGMPLVWAMNRFGTDLSDRVYGPTFTRKFLAQCPPGRSHYLVGGSPECGECFRARMLALNPSLDFVGGFHGKCSVDGILDEDDRVVAELQALSPDFIWVGLGTPKQYAWIHRIKPRLDRGVFLAVGFAFDVNAGMKSDAPQWMQRSGLTWLFRLLSEPARLAPRYLKYNSLFLWYLFGDHVLRRRPS